MEWMLSSETRCQLVAKPIHHELKLLVAGGGSTGNWKEKKLTKILSVLFTLTATPQEKMPHVCPHVSNSTFVSS
jgi:hypothetical protein